MLLARDVPVVPALYFEHASIVRGPEFGMSQRVIDGHQETLKAAPRAAVASSRPAAGSAWEATMASPGTHTATTRRN